MAFDLVLNYKLKWEMLFLYNERGKKDKMKIVKTLFKSISE